MCEAVTGATLFTLGTTNVPVGTALTAVSTLASVAGKVSAGRSARKVAERDAAILERNAATEKRNAQIRADQQKRQVAKIQAQNRANIGASGVRVEGSPVEVLANIEGEAERERRLILHGGDVRATGLLAEAESTRFRGEVAEGQAFSSSFVKLTSAAQKLKFPKTAAPDLVMTVPNGPF